MSNRNSASRTPESTASNLEDPKKTTSLSTFPQQFHSPDIKTSDFFNSDEKSGLIDSSKIPNTFSKSPKKNVNFKDSSQEKILNSQNNSKLNFQNFKSTYLHTSASNSALVSPVFPSSNFSFSDNASHIPKSPIGRFQNSTAERHSSEELLESLLDTSRKNNHHYLENAPLYDVLQTYLTAGTYSEFDPDMASTLNDSSQDYIPSSPEFEDEIERDYERKLVRRISKISGIAQEYSTSSGNSSSEDEQEDNQFSSNRTLSKRSTSSSENSNSSSFLNRLKYRFVDGKKAHQKDSRLSNKPLFNRNRFYSEESGLLDNSERISIDVNESYLTHRASLRDTRRSLVSKNLDFIPKNKLTSQKAKRILFFSPILGTLKSQSLDEIQSSHGNLVKIFKEVEDKKSCFWLDILAPTELEVKILSKTFKIHPLTVEDIIENDDSIRSKCEVYTGYYFVVLDLIDFSQQSSTYLLPSVTYILVTKNGVISFHSDPTCRRLHVLRWIHRLMHQTKMTTDWINYAIMDDIVDQIVPVVRFVEFEVETIDELVLIISSSEQSDMLQRIGAVRKRLMVLNRILQGKSDVVRILIKRFGSPVSSVPINSTDTNNIQTKKTPINNNSPDLSANKTRGVSNKHTQDIHLYLADILDHIVTMSQNAAHLEAVLSRSYSNYLAKISIELTESSNRTNDVMAKLSILASVLIPLNLITGLWGMNVPVPGQESGDLTWFISIVLCILSFAVFMTYICFKMGLF
ncbi:hypothetical protein BB560_000765 [Smittium megazygosporum]|uniref:Magnesium transporter n=1 Tax=Smittium megazygosporum TaxID=133381 RepID=A0A2T9ZJI7_9FUNG|nr:hypothetical protein BB560_000765 [Smittium megazygosporum]